MGIRRWSDLAVVAAVTVSVMIISLLGLGNGVLPAVLAVPVVLVCPGYALTSALFPWRVLGGAERLLATLGLSAALAVLSGMLLNFTPWGLQANSWALLLGSITLASCATALWRRPMSANIASGSLTGRFSARDAFLCGLAVLVAAAALGVARNGAIGQPTAGFTQLWLLPAGRGGTNRIRVGIRNMESRTTTYKLRVTVGSTTVLQQPSLTLRPGEHKDIWVDLPRTSATRIDGLLYRADVPHTVYRHVVLWRS